MPHMGTPLSDPEALDRYRVIVEATLLVGSPLTEPTRGYLEERAVELGVHRLDAEQVLAEVQALPSVRTALAILAAQRRQAQHDHEDGIAERVAARQFRTAITEQLTAERTQREALAVQVNQNQNLIEQLQQQLAAVEEQLRNVQTAPQQMAPSRSPDPEVDTAAEPPVIVVTEPPPMSTVTLPEPPNLPDGAELVLIPAGEFTMGSEERDSEHPIHTVYLDAYYIYKLPVTVRQYQQFCAATEHAMPAAPDFNTNWRREDHPIVNVSWADAMDYCRWVRGSLPTEAQWEKAARGADARRFPWGPEWNVGLCINSTTATWPVGSEPAGASAYGVLDMAGNVWEWCADWYDEGYYTASPPRNPSGPETGNLRVLRGGSWYFNLENLFRCTYRLRDAPGSRSDGNGFRCVVSVNNAWAVVL